ncbi:aldo keto reductase family protein [Amylolactobacillus amylotrophicus DSM 20534]|uniref:Aldo keto reductase family protein n=3 Tax=Amylolactobacillus TaxID=2767876 RepID=A0A0R1YTW1_9LACO|nr:MULTISPECIES: aldo/keto reductase [Amylolactobacillus]APT18367.1 2,5-diketo-D-gluconic acid reductase [Amylolactobacillus amylophilus DSM 20533 = JCM 1125]KRK38157.1 aldo keto reductase family protein [Amylolactobacillus amylotrophicus DSM 20534]KRM43209.1 aldo keto reductase family protein [Amylolactobacillus amylophilus DSM 20533 = JCM 1125]GED80387.1 dehydrogenase [Amylolactobacillus amylophilus]
MTSLTSTYKLQNGVEIPIVGFGTWQTPDGEVARSSVEMALRAGYRHIDTAEAYGNEESVGQGIIDSDVARSDIFLTSKLWNSYRGYDETIAAFNDSLKKLKTDYLDLFLIHWANPIKFRDHWQKSNAESWRAMEDLYEAGKIKAIGVSNFRTHHLEELKKTAKVLPLVNQMFLAPGELQPQETAYAKEHNILLEAYSPLGTGKIFTDPTMQKVAAETGKSVAQVAIKWSLAHGFLPLPKSVHEEYIKENANIFDFELTEEQVKTIDALDGVVGKATDPDTTNF